MPHPEIDIDISPATPADTEAIALCRAMEPDLIDRFFLPATHVYDGSEARVRVEHGLVAHLVPRQPREAEQAHLQG